MASHQLRPFSFYLKFLFSTLLVTVLAVTLFSAALLAVMVSSPIKYPLCCETPARFGAAYESMSFLTADGLRLSGWYVPAHNGAVIILLHSYHGDRRQTLAVAEMLYQGGYGLLMYDQRASGESAGQARSLGWLDIPDVSQAAQWLAGRNKDARLGVYGCSMGAAIGLAGAAQTQAIRAVAADAPSPLQWYENLPAFSLRDPFSLPVMALYYPLVMLRSRALPPTSTLEAVQAYGARPILFISTGSAAEYARVSSYYAAAVGSKEHWNIPDAGHCGGAAAHPQAYGQHLLEFFNSTLP